MNTAELLRRLHDFNAAQSEPAEEELAKAFTPCAADLLKRACQKGYITPSTEYSLVAA